MTPIAHQKVVIRQIHSFELACAAHPDLSAASSSSSILDLRMTMPAAEHMGAPPSQQPPD